MSETSGSGMRCRHGNDPFCCGICRNEEIESLRAQLQAARAEAFEWVWYNPPQKDYRGDVVEAREKYTARGLAALRAKGASNA